jgi:hypothetical protein
MNLNEDLFFRYGQAFPQQVRTNALAFAPAGLLPDLSTRMGLILDTEGAALMNWRTFVRLSIYDKMLFTEGSLPR